MLGVLQPNFAWMFLWRCILPENLRSTRQVFFEFFNFESSCWVKTTQKLSCSGWIIVQNLLCTEGVNCTQWLKQYKCVLYFAVDSFNQVFIIVNFGCLWNWSACVTLLRKQIILIEQYNKQLLEIKPMMFALLVLRLERFALQHHFVHIF